MLSVTNAHAQYFYCVLTHLVIFGLLRNFEQRVSRYFQISEAELNRGLGASIGHWVSGNENENLLLSPPSRQLSTKMMTCGGKRRIVR